MSRRRSLIAGWVLAALVIAAFVRLGFWQIHRAVEKQAMLDAAAKVLERRDPQPLALADDIARVHVYDWALGRGEFDTRDAMLLDNQQRSGRVGVRAYRIFLPEHGGPLLVDLGWLPLPGDRKLPQVPRPEGAFELRGLLAPPPSTGLALGPGLGRDHAAWLMTRIDLSAMKKATGLSMLAPRVLRLDPTMKLGYERDLELLPNTLPPEKHRGYAVQWFALALAVLTIALTLTFRTRRQA